MSATFVVAGTDTNVGKTVFAAALAGALDARYWKPIQAGNDGESDSAAVARLAGLPADRLIASAYNLALAASPHIAARREGIDIRQRALGLPVVDGPLVVETAGGVMVPLSLRVLQVDLMASWQKPVVLCARTSLGTINHTLLSLEALRRRRVPVHGVAFIGEAEPEVEATIAALGRVRSLGRLPWLEPLDAGSLRAAFAGGFDLRDFVEDEGARDEQRKPE
jgi:dethiobiotin synthetase